MLLVISGSWIRKRGFYFAKIKDVHFPKLEDLNDLNGNYFLVFSYDITSDTLGITVKKSELPAILAVKLDGFEGLDHSHSEGQVLTFVKSSFSDEEFVSKIHFVKELIKDGIIYQLNLTNKFDFLLEGSSFDLFYQFLQRQPVPYGFLLDLDDFFILSGSMELFLKKEGRRLWSKPIKGTSGSEEELRRSEKDKAENLMIIDVMRNDLGMVAEVGSVKVPELFKITKYNTLFQMHSTVECETSSSFLDIIKSTFPPASVTGAPKRKAVEIIDAIEPHARGFYCGCAGLFFSDSDFTLSVLIRTAVGRGETVSYYAGCGIVWDSDPEKELRELYMKIKAFHSFGR